ncbi:MAG: P1 family peptidase [Candidatus Nanopelagicales bacterium]|jgi:L-aminopeptidase/D-esterase-like protein|nr:P1 family peptidase [Candidatus Nanopelagicales bacterium]
MDDPARTGDPLTGAQGTLLPGVLVGHDTDSRRPTGVTVVLLPDGTTAGVDVRGAAPGTRETDLLDPVDTIDVAHAVVLAGGSAYGLATADGVMRWLEAQGRGVPVGPVRVPIVPAAVLFDLLVGDPTVRPDAPAGERACAAAVPIAQAGVGSVGAGAGATVGKLLGPDRAMRGGVGIASITASGFQMAAVVAVNAMGDVVDPADGTVLAGARTAPDRLELADTVGSMLGSAGAGVRPLLGSSTTIGVIVTDARLTKAQARRLAQVGHDGLARTIRPAHTTMDGDTLFAAGTGTAGDRGADMLLLSTMAAEVTARAVVAAVRGAQPGLQVGPFWLPAAAERAAAG